MLANGQLLIYVEPFYFQKCKLSTHLGDHISKLSSFSFSGTVDVDAKVYLPRSAAAAASATISSAPATTSSAPATPSTAESSRKLACDIYKTRDGKHFLSVSRKTDKIQGRKTEEIQKMLQDKSVRQLVDEGELVRNFICMCSGDPNTVRALVPNTFGFLMVERCLHVEWFYVNIIYKLIQVYSLLVIYKSRDYSIYVTTLPIL